LKTPCDKRRSTRELCAHIVRITWLDDNGRPVSSLGLIEDVSANGFCVSLQMPVTSGRDVQVHTDGGVGSARVRYCEVGDYGYLLGLELSPGDAWDPGKWRPKHLLRHTSTGKPGHSG
jgi:hypothetical protein